MVIIINDQKRASGKTTLAKEFLKGKRYIEINTMSAFLYRFWNYSIIPEFVLIDGASEGDIEVANEITQKNMLSFDVKYSENKVRMQPPTFVLVTNQELKIKLI